MPVVSSSAISHVDYDPLTAELHVTFTTTGLYTYTGVPHQVYEDFLTAASKGRFFNDNIRDHYRYRAGTAWSRR